MPPTPERTADLPKSAGPHLVSLFSRRARWKYRIAITLWCALTAYFWQWWLDPANNIGLLRNIVVTTAVGWIFFLQAYFLIIFPRASHTTHTVGDLGPARVAMVTTKTPSEPFAVVRQTLEAMLAQDYPHDTWLADEDPDPETIAWCEEHGVRISTRRDRPDYHRTEWPRRTRCKEGNLAFFYDSYGYENYDFVSQFDADHVPDPGYLRAVLAPFGDPQVGYVSAPSICSRNAGNSWAARSRLYSEAVHHGALQAGYSKGWAPMCVGSHYAVRTAALKQIGGLGPELAEDQSTSMMMNAFGWRGVHAIDAIAHGDGPATFADMLTQEFQWSRSLVSLLLRHTPRYFSGLPAILKFQFLFSQLWYSLFAAFMALSFLLPLIAVVFDIHYIDVSYPGFIGHSLPPMLVVIWIAYQLRADGLFRPPGAKVLSWERTLFASAQWPWVLWGSLMAVRDRLTGSFVDFRVTPKGEAATAQLPIRVLVPYVLLASASSLPVWLIDDVSEASGFYFLSLINAVIYTVLFAVVLVHHLQENRIPLSSNIPRHGLQFLAAAGLCALIAAAGTARGMQGLHYLSTGLGPFQFTEERYVVSGAGIGKTQPVRYVIDYERLSQWASEFSDLFRRNEDGS
jgi:cellulose synthase (UDP-forming)